MCPLRQTLTGLLALVVSLSACPWLCVHELRSDAQAMRGGAAAVAHRRREQHRLRAKPLRPPTVRRPNRRRPDRLSRLFRRGSDHEPSRAEPRRAAPSRAAPRRAAPPRRADSNMRSCGCVAQQDSRTIWIDGRHRCLMPVLDFVNNKDLHSMTRTAHSAHGMQRAASRCFGAHWCCAPARLVSCDGCCAPVRRPPCATCTS